MDDINQLILTEIQGMRKELNDGFSETKQRITAIETHTKPFFATEGGKDKIEEDVKDLQKTKWYIMGGAGVLAGSLHTILKKIGL